MINKLIVVIGPQGCGKTMNRDALAYFFKADVLLDSDPYTMAFTTGCKKYARHLASMIEHDHQGAKVALALVNDIHPLTEGFLHAYFDNSHLEIHQYYSIIEEAKRVYKNRMTPFSYALGAGAKMKIDVGQSSEMISKPHRTHTSLREKNGSGGCVILTDLYERDTTLIMQRGLVTKIETSVDRDELLALAAACTSHLQQALPEGLGPLAWFHHLQDEAIRKDEPFIVMSRGHVNLISEHIRLLEQQLGDLQKQANDPDRIRHINEHAAIINLLGHVQDGSDQVLTIGQQKSGETWSGDIESSTTCNVIWFVNANGNAKYGASLKEALDEHFKDEGRG